MQTHLLGYEFPSTLMLLGKNKVYFVVSAAKGSSLLQSNDAVKLICSFLPPSNAAKLLTPIKTPPASAGEQVVEVEILTRSKDEKENAALFEQIAEVIGAGVSSGLGSGKQAEMILIEIGAGVGQDRYPSQGQNDW